MKRKAGKRWGAFTFPGLDSYIPAGVCLLEDGLGMSGPLAEELEDARNYFMIQRFQFNNRFFLQTPFFSQKLRESCCLPKPALRPILKNAILRGMKGKVGFRMISVRVEAVESGRILVIFDDGSGMRALHP